ncbi:CsxC family protein [Petroclostridium sp. X23]|uniref:CsxC family protein n=1 Tax=Petroclostridium sp. X23 TaxID=3045146 RepID=UPI0024AE0A8D|nr:hypothetical protein [Petroclostridium sp. X23]WHH59604.1 hypothetical protein QKW49_02250 [Petroclostridium sp. X23]
MDGIDSKNRVNNAKIIKTCVVNECSSECITPVGKNGPVITKIPVVIAQPEVQINIESIIELEQAALEIKEVKKNVFLTQCKLIHIDSSKVGKLFLNGFVRKNIEYATVESECTKNRVINGSVCHTTVNIPFKCVTKVEYSVPPITCNKNSASQIAIFTDKLAGCDPCGQNIIGNDPCEQSFQHVECLSEEVFCELVEVKIFEEDTHREPVSLGCEFSNEQLFDSFVEKMVLFIRLKLLQKQQIYIPAPYEAMREEYGTNEKKKENTCNKVEKNRHDVKKGYVKSAGTLYTGCKSH